MNKGFCFGVSGALALFLLAGCLKQEQVPRANQDLSGVLTAEEAAKTQAEKEAVETTKKETEALLSSIRDPRSASGDAARPIDCEKLCPQQPSLACASASPNASPEASPSPTSGLNAASVCGSNARTFSEGLAALLDPQVMPRLNSSIVPASVHVLKDYAGNLIFSMRTEGEKKVYYAVLKPDGSTLGWQVIGSPFPASNIDEYAISTSAISYKLHIVIRSGVDLRHCIFEVGNVCLNATDWKPILPLHVAGVGDRDRLSAIKAGTLNLVEVPDMGVALGLLGLPATADSNANLDPAQGYFRLATVFTEKPTTAVIPTNADPKYISQWQPTWDQSQGQSWINDLAMVYFPVQWNFDGQNIVNELIDHVVFVSIWNHPEAHMHVAYNSGWQLHEHTVGTRAYKSWFFNVPAALSLHKGTTNEDQTKKIEEVVYQQGLPGFDVFAINTADHLLHVWRRAQNGTGGSGVETEVDGSREVSVISASYSRILSKTFVAVIQRDGSTHPIWFKTLHGDYQSVSDTNKLSDGAWSGAWQEIPGLFSLLDTVDTPYGIVGIAYDTAQGLKFLMCNSATQCSLVE